MVKFSISLFMPFRCCLIWFPSILQNFKSFQGLHVGYHLQNTGGKMSGKFIDITDEMKQDI
jgi:hypothetical protein